MTWPGPPILGRGIVVGAAATVPEPLREAPAVTLRPETLQDPQQLAAAVDQLHDSWVSRTPTVIRWELDDDALAAAERNHAPVWSVSPEFLFPLERLRFLVFSNNYDARSGEPRWWWAHKARAVGAVPGGPADVLLADDNPAWVDGGPHRPLEPLEHDVIHGDTIDVGRARPLPPPAVHQPAGLAADQGLAVLHPSGPARIIAPAGSGKTRTLAARLRHLLDDRGIEPATLMAVAYNARAAADLRARTAAPRKTVRTIHSLGWEILGEARPGLKLVDEKEARSVLAGLVQVPRRPNRDPLGPYVEALDQVRAGLRDPALVEERHDDVPGFGTIFEPYRARLYARAQADHGEQVYGAIEALLRDPDLRRRWQRRCRHVLVDEFQDLTPAYLLLLRLLASPQLQVFGVGDDDQVIYGYAGADPRYLIEFARLFPGAAHHALATNYRCPGDVVTAATKLLAHNQRRIDKTIHAADGRVTDTGLRVVTAPGEMLAREAAEIVAGWEAEGVAPADIAVLSRVNAALIPVKAALQDRGTATNDLLDAGSLQRTALRALLAWMRIATQPDRMRRGDVMEAVRRPSRGLTGAAQRVLPRRGVVDLTRLTATSAELDDKQARRWDGFVSDVAVAAEVATRGDASAMVGFLVGEVGLASSARTLDASRSDASRSSHHDDLVAVRRAAALHPGLDDFLPWLAEAVARPSSSDGVTLSSVHRVKGREWSRVLVFGVDQGAMPHELADDLEEERRVFHVALTRAREEAVVLADAARPSRFLAELTGSSPVTDAPPQPAPLPVADDGGVKDPELAAALRAWRLETSRRLGVPAYVVFNDRTLDEIARLRPATERALISIHGIGPRKLEDHGDEILGLVAEHAVGAPEGAASW